MPKSFVDQAFESLADCDLVLGPTEDGGYYLIGIAGELPEVFSGIPWSTPEVFQATVDAADRARARLITLPSWYDVDNGGDLARLQRDLRQDGCDDPALRQLLDHLSSSC